MNIVSLINMGKTVGNGRLFDDVTLGLEEGEKLGLVGRNGVGKSTLLRILAGELEPDEGEVVHSRTARISRLDQRPGLAPGVTVEQHLFPELSIGGESAVTFGLEAEEQASTLQRYQAFCTRLGIDDTHVELQTLSGGMFKKVSIARCLAFDADLYLLDEPTNHLDLDAITWLEQYLERSSAGFVLVTHDRYILDAVCDTILEIDGGEVFRHPGNYSAYLERRAERLREESVAEDRRRSILRRELEWLQRGPKARTGKDKKRKERIGEMLELAPGRGAVLQDLPAAQRRLGKKVLELEGVTKSYNGRPVISKFSHRFAPGERVGVIGPNGSGKTTLLDLVAGRTEPDHGTIEWGETVAIAYFDQTGKRLPGETTVLEYLKEEAERVRIDDQTSVSAEQFLERFLFPRSMLAQPLERLSGGELRRLYLVRLLARAPNFLLLDEPTNDLDLDTLRVVEQYLDGFAGCILLVSHDRALLDRLTDSLLVLDGGGIRRFVGSYDEVRAAAGEDSALPGSGGAPGGDWTAYRSTRAAQSAARAAGKAINREPKQGLSFREQREYDQLPDKIEETERELSQLEALFQQPEQNPAVLEQNTKRYHALRDRLEQMTARWEELGERAGE